MVKSSSCLYAPSFLLTVPIYCSTTEGFRKRWKRRWSEWRRGFGRRYSKTKEQAKRTGRCNQTERKEASFCFLVYIFNVCCICKVYIYVGNFQWYSQIFFLLYFLQIIMWRDYTKSNSNSNIFIIFMHNYYVDILLLQCSYSKTAFTNEKKNWYIQSWHQKKTNNLLIKVTWTAFICFEAFSKVVLCGWHFGPLEPFGKSSICLKWAILSLGESASLLLPKTSFHNFSRAPVK